MNQREKFRSWWINSFSLLSPPYPQCLEHTHSNASCLIVPELLGHIVRHGDHLSRKNHYHFVLYTIKVLGLVKVKCHILSLDIVLLTWQGCLLSFRTFFALRQLGEFALWLIFKPCHINRDKIVQNFLQPFLFKLLSFTLSDNSQFGPNTIKASPKQIIKKQPLVHRSGISPQNGLLDFMHLFVSSCCSLSLSPRRCHLPPSSHKNDCKTIFQIWYEALLSFDMMIRHLPKYATIWYPSYVRFFCPPPKPPINTCDVFLNCEFRKSTSSIHVIINISHPTVPHFLKQFGLKAAPQLYFGHNRSGSFSNIGHFIVSSPELTTPVWDGRIIYPSSALSEQHFFKGFFFASKTKCMICKIVWQFLNVVFFLEMLPRLLLTLPVAAQ